MRQTPGRWASELQTWREWQNKKDNFYKYDKKDKYYKPDSDHKKQPGHRQFLSRAVESWEGVSFIVTGDDDHDGGDDNGHDHDDRVVCIKHVYIRYNKP